MRRPLLLAALLLPAAPVLAGDLQEAIGARLRGAFAVTSVEVFSDCAGTYTDNRVNGRLVSGRGRMRFKGGELARIDKIDLKRSRLDVSVSLTEPVLMPRRDGPFTLYDEAWCRLELEVELPRNLVSREDVAGIEALLAPILGRFETEDDARRARGYNGREREAYPADYQMTLARHAAWKAEQVNAGVQARLDEATREAGRINASLAGDAEYLQGFGRGVEAARAIRINGCGDLMAVKLAPPTRAGTSYAATGAPPKATRADRGHDDGYSLVLTLRLLEGLPACFVPVPEIPAR